MRTLVVVMMLCVACPGPATEDGGTAGGGTAGGGTAGGGTAGGGTAGGGTAGGGTAGGGTAGGGTAGGGTAGGGTAGGGTAGGGTAGGGTAGGGTAGGGTAGGGTAGGGTAGGGTAGGGTAGGSASCTTAMCSTYATCMNITGGYTCTCNTGFSGDGGTCSNINECAAPGSCSPHATCMDTFGSYTCRCIAGFIGDGGVCADIDECSQPVCDPKATCTNTDGGYACACPAGFAGNGTACAQVFAVSTPISELALADLNRDGLTDVLGFSCGLGSVVVLFNDGGTGLQSQAPADAGRFSCIYQPTLRDVNGDGLLDLLGRFGYSAVVRLGDGTGRFASPSTYLFGGNGGVQQVAFGDFNQDGRLDVTTGILATTGGFWLVVMFGAPGGGFGSPLQIGAVLKNGIVGVAAGDFDGDGKLDIAGSIPSHPNQPDPLPDNTVLIYLGNGAGSFSAPVINQCPGTNSFTSPTPAWEMFAGDWNIDGRADLVIRHHDLFNGDVGHVWRSRSGGMLDMFGQQLAGNFGTVVTGPEDFTGDGRLDFTLRQPGRFQLFAGTADGGIRDGGIFGIDTWEVHAADLDHDGGPDWVMSLPSGGIGVIFH